MWWFLEVPPKEIVIPGNCRPFANDNDSYWLGWLIYLFMIDEHIIISIEFGCNSFNATCDFNTKICFPKGEVFMNWNVCDECIMVKKAQGK